MGMIAIKEFKMPVTCETCKFSSLINGNCIITGEPLDLINMDEYRMHECPLVEVEE